MARRQKDDAGERRTAAIKVQLTPAEREELDKRAAMTGRSLSDFVRIVLLSDLKAPAPTARDPSAIRALAVAINRVGANHDQLLKLANQARSLPYERHRKAASEALAAAFEKGEFREVSSSIVTALEKVMEL